LYKSKDIKTSSKLSNIVKGNCTVRDDTARGPAAYPTVLLVLPTPGRTGPTLPFLEILYSNIKRKELIALQLIRGEGPKAPFLTYTQIPRDTYLRSLAVQYADLLR
jgi:hypothetical protein